MNKKNTIIFNVLFGIVLLLHSAMCSFVSTDVRSRRSIIKIDTSLKVPELNPLTERAQIDSVWEQCMIVAPSTIQLLGQLLVVSSAKDVSFRDFSPDKKFNYIRNPDSLRATLLQISHEGYHAFLSGHSAMNTIQMRMVQIPKHIKTALKLLGGNFPRHVLAGLLPQVLSNIEYTGDECVNVTKETADEFSKVMKLLEEVIETTETTKTVHQSKVTENEIQQAVLQSQKKDWKKEEKLRAQMYREAADIAAKADETYNQALKDIPSGWELILQDFTRSVVRLVNTVSDTATSIISGSFITNTVQGVVGAFVNAGSSVPLLYHQPNVGNGAVTERPLSAGFKQTLRMIRDFSNNLQSFRNDVLKPNIDPQSCTSYGISFRTFRQCILNFPSNPAKEKAISIIERCEELAKQARIRNKNSKLVNKQLKEWTNTYTNIWNDLQTLLTASYYADQTISGDTQPKNDGFVTTSSRNEIVKLEISQKNLVAMRRRQDQQAEEYLKVLETIRQTNAKMIAIDLTTINYNQIIKMLKEAFDLLVQVRQQWNNFVIFFTEMSQYIKNMVRNPLRRFLQVSSYGTTLDRVLRLQLIDVLKEDTFGIHRESYVLFVMARTYHDVSSKYLMGRLASLSSMLSSRTESEKQELMRNLTMDTDHALTQIRGLIIERKAAFDKELNTRHAELSDLIEKLGGPTEDDLFSMKEAQKLISNDAAWGDK